MMMINDSRVKLLVTLSVGVLLGGCSQGSGFSDLDDFMSETRSKPRGYVEPLPEFKAYEAFNYSAADRRSPFEVPIEAQLTMMDDAAPPAEEIKPDLDRPREVLENFALSDLSMVGTLSNVEDGDLFALVSDGEGGVHRVNTGNYIGTNYGRIIGVSESRIELIEIVPNGRGGWVERPRSLSLDQNQSEG